MYILDYFMEIRNCGVLIYFKFYYYKIYLVKCIVNFYCT